MPGLTSYSGRLAPSPTGLLHLGHVRTFAVAHSRAAEAGGLLRLRIDDLDPQRSRAGFVNAAVDDLRWLGLDWHGEPMRQSQRGEAYLAAWQALVAGGYVYPCVCSRRELQALTSAPHEYPDMQQPQEDETVYPGRCWPAWLPGETSGARQREEWLRTGPVGRNWRFRVPPERVVSFHDGGSGRQQFTAGRDFGDFAVWRRDGVPAYQLATVADDAAMGITEVVRGADLLLSTARQILLYEALGLPAPAWFHCPLVLDETGHRLAKRSHALSVRSLRESGLSPERMLAMARQVRTAASA